MHPSPFPSTPTISLPFSAPKRVRTRATTILLSPLLALSQRSPCRSFTSPTLVSAPSATVSGVIGWPCILSLSVTAQACGSSSFRFRVFTFEKNFLPFRNINKRATVCTRDFFDSIESIFFDNKFNSTLLVNVAGNIARVNLVNFFYTQGGFRARFVGFIYL